MTHSKLLQRLLVSLTVVAVLSIITFTSCTKINYSVGSDQIPSDQTTAIGQMSFSGLTSGGVNYIESRLYRSDSIMGSELLYGFVGESRNDTFGMRGASFFSQYIPTSELDEDDLFGYMPIFDSAILYISLNSYAGDTNYVQKFEVFEIVDDSFVYESTDTIFFPSFNIEPYLSSEPIFTFTYPDQDNGVYFGTSYVRMYETDLSKDFIDRLMLENITGDYDYTIYEDEEEWVEYFKGIYIRPAADQLAGTGNDGMMYSFDLSSSGFGFFSRSRVEEDPTLINDTLSTSYLFYYSDADAGNVNISMFEHDYSNSMINEAEIKSDDNPDVATTTTLFVEGIAGVVSELTLTEEFFAELDTILDTEEATTGEIYTDLFFNQAQIKIYMTEVDSYDYTEIDPYTVTPWMDYMPTRLGMYINWCYYLNEYEDYEDVWYYTLSGIADYYYAYDSSYTLDYGGDLNRSWGCYVMNISGQIQSVWNYYLAAKAKAGGVVEDIDWDSVTGRTIYLAPVSSEIYGFKYAMLQASDQTENTVPISLDLTYTLVR